MGAYPRIFLVEAALHHAHDLRMHDPERFMLTWVAIAVLAIWLLLLTLWSFKTWVGSRAKN